MSKKKNTLKDLDDFLKQQAATLVSPAKLSEQIETPPPPAAEAAPVVSPQVTTPPVVEPAPAVVEEVTTAKILEAIKTLAQKEGTTVHYKLYDVILQAAETKVISSAEDKMLINTVLFLKSGDNWKDVIRDYWKNR
jgi:hypothetical protein